MTNDANGFFAIPRTLVWAVVLALPSMLIAGTTYVVLQTSNAAQTSERLNRLEMRADAAPTTDRMLRLEARVEATASLGESSRAVISDLVQQGNLKMTRMEAQLGFLVGTTPSRR